MKRSAFNLGYTKLATMDMGMLVPIGLTEVLPGDSFNHRTSVLLRCAALLAPVMHPVDISVHHFYCPHRLLWNKARDAEEEDIGNGFDDFITGGPDGDDESAWPVIAAPPSTGFAIGSLGDYLGVPTGVADLQVSALPFRMYNFIWNKYYRDQDLQTELDISFESEVGSLDTETSTVLQRGAWQKDYFTSARPDPQKGPEITIPLGALAPVVFFQDEDQGDVVTLQRNSGTASTPVDVVEAGVSDDAIEAFADLSNASAVSVTRLREALALQRVEENRSRFGSTIVDYLAMLGVRGSDGRLQRPEYLGGGKATVQFSEIVATAETGTAVDVGDLKGHGIATARSNRYQRFFEENGYVMTLLCVRPRTIYQQGLFRHWNRRTREEFFQPELQHIGQQEVQYKEVYAGHATPEATFGWQDRYDEYRRSESLVSGEFRSSLLNYWHFARTFASDPALNASFVSCVPSEIPFADTTSHVLQVQIRHNLRARRIVSQMARNFIF